jgi:hypothetical protein
MFCLAVLSSLFGAQQPILADDDLNLLISDKVSDKGKSVQKVASFSFLFFFKKHPTLFRYETVDALFFNRFSLTVDVPKTNPVQSR